MFALILDLYDRRDNHRAITYNFDQAGFTSNQIGKLIQQIYQLASQNTLFASGLVIIIIITELILILLWYKNNSLKTLAISRLFKITTLYTGFILFFHFTLFNSAIFKFNSFYSILVSLYILIILTVVILVMWYLILVLIPLPSKDEDESRTDNTEDQPIDWGKISEIIKNSTNKTLFSDLTSNVKRFRESLNDKNFENSSYCICLNGSWGSGKTSFLNLVRSQPADQQLKDRVGEKLNKNIVWIDDFNPWNFGNSSELIQNFFDTLAIKLDSECSIILNNEYNTYVQLATLSLEKADFPFNLISIFKQTKDIASLKEYIKRKLKKSSKKLVFVLDDIDRMMYEEIMEILRLVKVVADFPNIIFVLSMDYEKVRELIKKENTDAFSNYLNKIIQEKIDL